MKEEKKVICPNCGSAEVSRQKSLGLTFTISFLLLGFPVPAWRKKYHCFNCGADFKLQTTIQKTDDN